MDWGRLVV